MASTPDLKFNVDIRVFKGDELVKLIEDTQGLEYSSRYKKEVAWAVVMEALDAYIQVTGSQSPELRGILAGYVIMYLENWEQKDAPNEQ